MSNVINLEEKRKEKNGTVTIPIIERIYVENGEAKADVVGEREVPKDMIDKK